MKKMIKKIKRMGNQKGVALIWAYLIAVFLLTVLTGFYNLSSADAKIAAIDMQSTQAFYLAEAGIDKKLVEVRAGNINPISATSLGSVGTYQATYNPLTKLITATGTSGSVSRTVTAKASVENSIPPGVGGALTVSTQTTFIGELTFDGRDYDINGNLIGSSATGTYGVAYHGGVPNYDQKNRVGGFQSDVAAPPVDPSVVFSLASNSNLTSVKAVLGLSPASIALVPYQQAVPSAAPVTNTVYYYVVPPSVTGNFTIDLQNGSGLLIVSNPLTLNADVTFTGNFTGLIIADKPSFNNAKVVGAVVALNAGANAQISELSTIKRTKINSSKAAVQAAFGYLGNTSTTAISRWGDHTNGSGRV